MGEDSCVPRLFCTKRRGEKQQGEGRNIGNIASWAGEQPASNIPTHTREQCESDSRGHSNGDYSLTEIHHIHDVEPRRTVYWAWLSTWKKPMGKEGFVFYVLSVREKRVIFTVFLVIFPNAGQRSKCLQLGSRSGRYADLSSKQKSAWDSTKDGHAFFSGIRQGSLLPREGDLCLWSPDLPKYEYRSNINIQLRQTKTL